MGLHSFQQSLAYAALLFASALRIWEDPPNQPRRLQAAFVIVSSPPRQQQVKAIVRLHAAKIHTSPLIAKQTEAAKTITNQNQTVCRTFLARWIRNQTSPTSHNAGSRRPCTTCQVMCRKCQPRRRTRSFNQFRTRNESQSIQDS